MNYYELLNIPRDAASGEIKRAYFSAVKTHPPDFDPEGFKAIRSAYETLSDTKKRAEYDAYFTVSDDGMQNDLLAARSLIMENKYKQAHIFLTGLSGKNPDSPEVARLLAEVLWRLKKSVAADNLCASLLEKNPADVDTLVLRAKIAASRGHTTKAKGYFESAAGLAELNPKVWTEYMYFAQNHQMWMMSAILQRASKLDADMFRDDYIWYLLGALEMSFFDIDGEEAAKYYDKFGDFFISDKNMKKDIYATVMNLLPRITENDKLMPFVKKILPALEKSKYRFDASRNKIYEEDLKFTHVYIATHELRSDNRMHDALVNLTEFFLYEEEDKNERLLTECYIAFNLPLLRPSIKILKNEYPQYFALNEAFFLEALNEKKEEFFTDKYRAVLKKLKPKLKSRINYITDEEDDYGDEKISPVVREEPKISRNALCPCGSGKKYKRCCL